MATLATVDAILREFPETIEGTSYGTPAFRVRRKLLVRWNDKLDALVIHTGFALREALLASGSDVWFTTPHYDGSAMVLARLDRLSDDALREVLVNAWLEIAPAKLAAEWRERVGARCLE